MIWYFLIRFWYDSPCSSCLSGCPFRWIQTVISLIWTCLFSQHRFATHQRVGGKDERWLGVPRTEHTRRVDRPRAHWLLYPGTNFKTRSNGQNPSDSWLLRILLNQASTHLMHVGVRTNISWVCSNWNASTSAVQNYTIWLFNVGKVEIMVNHQKPSNQTSKLC